MPIEVEGEGEGEESESDDRFDIYKIVANRTTTYNHDHFSRTNRSLSMLRVFVHYSQL